MTFEEIWEMTAEGDAELIDRAKTIFEEGKKLGWNEDLLIALIGHYRFSELQIKYLDEEKATKQSVRAVENKLSKHKHFSDGQAVEPL